MKYVKQPLPQNVEFYQFSGNPIWKKGENSDDQRFNKSVVCSLFPFERINNSLLGKGLNSNHRLSL